MKKKKIIIISVVTFCLAVSVGLAVFLCVKNHRKNSNVDMSVAFKSVAVNMWSKIGVEDAIGNSGEVAAASYYDVPQKAEMPNTDGDTMQLKLTVNSMASLLYFVGTLFENSDFSVINNIAKFSTTVSSGGGEEKNYSFTVSPIVSPSKNKLTLNVYYEVNSAIYYYVVEADYNFKTKTLNSARVYAKEDTLYVDIQLSKNGELLIYSTYNTGDSISNAIETDISYFLQYARFVERSSKTFSSELNNMLNINNNVLKMFTVK